MKYYSTRGGVEPLSSAEAILQGLAADGGLFVPESFPAFFPKDLVNLSYQDLARKVFSLYLTDFTPEQIDEVVDGAYSKTAFPDGPAPCTSVGDNMEVLELWHGPTSAFKDLALQALPRLMSVSRRITGMNGEIVILVATSGDTGKAALEGFKDVDGIKIIVFYPYGGVSRIQELQMNTTTGNNTYVVGVNGNFDDCQTGVKKIFSGEQFACFSSANSINWGRLLPQIVYYFYAYGQMEKKGKIQHGEPIDICVPTGNFGDILAGVYAEKMGLPVGQFICASNINNVLTEALNEGHYNSKRPFFKTTSPSMDILVSSNFERFIYHSAGNDGAYTAKVFGQLKADGEYQIKETVRQNWQGKMAAAYSDQKEADAAIAEAWERDHYLIDPHTSVGWAVAKKVPRSAEGRQLLLVSTASAYKFPASVLTALGKDISAVDEMELPGMLKSLTGMPIPANLADLPKMEIRHNRQTEIAAMPQTVKDILQGKK